MTEEVNRLKKISKSLERDPNPAPTRALKAILPRISIVLGEKDFPKISDLGPEGVLKRLRSLSEPYNQITSVRVYHHTKELHLTTQSRPIYEQLIQDNNFATLMVKLGLTPWHSKRKPEMYWVILNEYNLANEYLKNCKDYLASMKRDTGLDINEVKYTQQRFLWGFMDPGEAMKACQQPLFFSGDHALAMAYDPRGTPQFCLRCGRPDHTLEYTKCPNANLSKEESWPCIVCAQKHPGPGATSQCPNRYDKTLFRCLNCIEAGLDNANHRTDFYKCPAPIAVSQRAMWKNFASKLPEWAATRAFPSTDELRARVESGDFPKRPGKRKSSDDADRSGQAEGSGPRQILHRKGLMKPKEDPKSLPEEQATEFDDEVMVFEATQAAIIETLNPSPSTTVDQPSRKIRQILDWAKPIGGSLKSSLSTPPRSNTDPISPARDDNAILKRPRGRPKGSLAKKRARVESGSSPQGSPLKRRSDVFNDEAPSSSAEPVSSPVKITDITQSSQSNEEIHNDLVDLVQSSDYNSASIWRNEDEDG
ncbi:hypothetical protein yc1106_09114 [Curvularia clavata]|uniref:Uncharacterized protein n=1 Tax=Curvularia clavata TaxID=95742 RepID=A0A9Q8ZGN3_CURCL|nr:hypothetical protein yc1106_09114 [Curvularia clavata]